MVLDFKTCCILLNTETNKENPCCVNHCPRKFGRRVYGLAFEKTHNKDLFRISSIVSISILLLVLLQTICSKNIVHMCAVIFEFSVSHLHFSVMFLSVLLHLSIYLSIYLSIDLSIIYIRYILLYLLYIYIWFHIKWYWIALSAHCWLLLHFRKNVSYVWLFSYSLSIVAQY